VIGWTFELLGQQLAVVRIDWGGGGGVLLALPDANGMCVERTRDVERGLVLRLLNSAPTPPSTPPQPTPL